MILGKLCYPKWFLLIKGVPTNIIIICPDDFVFEVHARVFKKLPKCFSRWNWWFRAFRSRFYDPKNPSPLVWETPTKWMSWLIMHFEDRCISYMEKRVNVFKPATCASIFLQRVYWLSVVWLAKQMEPCFLSHWLTLSATRSQVLIRPEGPAIGGAFHAGIEAQHVQRGGFGWWEKMRRSWLY